MKCMYVPEDDIADVLLHEKAWKDHSTHEGNSKLLEPEFWKKIDFSRYEGMWNLYDGTQNT